MHISSGVKKSLHACLYWTRSGVMRRDLGHTPKMEDFVF